MAEVEEMFFPVSFFELIFLNAHSKATNDQDLQYLMQWPK
jgi:hypothetical protein